MEVLKKVDVSLEWKIIAHSAGDESTGEEIIYDEFDNTNVDLNNKANKFIEDKIKNYIAKENADCREGKDIWMVPQYM